MNNYTEKNQFFVLSVLSRLSIDCLLHACLNAVKTMSAKDCNHGASDFLVSCYNKVAKSRINAIFSAVYFYSRVRTNSWNQNREYRKSCLHIQVYNICSLSSSYFRKSTTINMVTVSHQTGRQMVYACCCDYVSTVKRERSMMHKYECSDGRLVPAGNPDKERWYVNVTSTDRQKLE